MHRCGAVASLTAKSLHVEGAGAIYARLGENLSELDGQLLFDLGLPDDAELEEIFASAEAAEAEGRYDEAAALYQRCLAIDPGDAVAAFNRANCLRAAGRHAEAAHDYARAIKLDPGFVEAWFNLAGLTAERGHVGAARRHLKKASALDADYADAVFNLAKLEFDAGDLAEARRCWAAISSSTASRNGRGSPPAASSSSISSWPCGRQDDGRTGPAPRVLDAPMSRDFLFDGSATAPATILLAHGAGAAMDSASLSAMAEALASAGLRVARFEFGYMAARRTTEGRKPPPRAETLIAEYRSAVAELAANAPLIIGGKSMGGRVASMVADELFEAGKIAGLVCLGYPFHPPGRPEQLRTAHLEHLRTPTLICQGTRDEFGTREEVAAYRLSPTHRVPLAGGWRPRSQAAQERLGFLGRRPSEDHGGGGPRVCGSPRPDSPLTRLTLKIATFNVNNINKRLDMLLAWLAATRPDVVCLQELKAADRQFPRARSRRQAMARCGAASRPGTASPSSPAAPSRC